MILFKGLFGRVVSLRIVPDKKDVFTEIGTKKRQDSTLNNSTRT